HAEEIDLARRGRAGSGFAARACRGNECADAALVFGRSKCSTMARTSIVRCCSRVVVACLGGHTMHVNLLPQPFLRQLVLRRQVRRWGIAIACALVVSSGFVAIQYCSVSSARHAQAATAVRSKDLHAVKAKTAQLLTEAKTIETSIDALHQSQ